MKRIIIYVFLIASACNEPAANVSTSTSQTSTSNVDTSRLATLRDPYAMMALSFYGNPTKEQLQPLLDRVMAKYGYKVTTDNVITTGNILMTYRNRSKAETTEMEILQHMYTQGSTDYSFREQAALSQIFLDTKNVITAAPN